MTESQNQTYGSWTLGDRLGSGGFGTTYKAEREISLLGEKFTQRGAIKVIRDDRLGDRAAKQEFVREITLLSRINSPYIVSLLDAGIEGDEIWFAQELINGQNLSKFMNRQPLSESVWEDLATQMLLALKSVHAENISHLDIKPANIMFAQGSESFRLIDFGISKTQSAKGVKAPTYGTYTYMPAEQFASHPHKQSDIWSLGITLYEAATGVHPITGTRVDWAEMSEFERYQASMLFAVSPALDLSLVANEGHRKIIDMMVQHDIDKRSTPSVLLQELRLVQGYRDPVITLGGVGRTPAGNASHWANFDGEGLDEFEKWQQIRKVLPELLKKKGTKVATITVDVQSSELSDIDIRCELFAGGKTLKLTAPEPKSPGLHKAHTLGWEAAQLPSEIFMDLPGDASFDLIGERVADLLEIAFALPAVQIRIF